MCTALGVAPDEAGCMDWAATMDLFRYWAEQPPVHEMVAAYFGIGPKGPPPKPLDVNELRAKGEAMKRAFASGTKVVLA